MLHTSDQIGEIAKALSKAQAKIRHAAKDNVNPHFKSKYADLASVFDSIRMPLAENGLSFVQGLGNEGPTITCTTVLMHESGQWIKSQFGLTPQQSSPQAGGSCATYLRRYSIQSMIGVAADEDDDGNAATAPKAMAFNSQANLKTNTAKSPVVEKTSQTPANTATGPETFDAKNGQHLKLIASYLERRGNPGLQKSLVDRMTGKAITKTNLDAEYDAINPDTPDKEPS